MSVYLGTSSNWSFSRRVLDSASRSAFGSPLGPEDFVRDGDVYDLDWDGSKAGIDQKHPLPSLNHAKYLVHTVQFHVGEVYHLFDEEIFMHSLRLHYEDQSTSLRQNTLWCVHYLVIMAFGKVFASTAKAASRKPPGVEHFIHAMQLLPDVTQLWKDPYTAAEVYCCVALYLQCLDFRYGAYLTVSCLDRDQFRTETNGRSDTR
jgi:proline utilization trans-activator